MLESNPELNLIDDQKVASRESWSYLDCAKKMAKAHAHRKGGPETEKNREAKLYRH